MKKRLIAGICTAVLLFSIGAVQAFAAPGSPMKGAPPAMGQQFGERPEGMPGGAPGERPEGMPGGVPGERPEGMRGGMPGAPGGFQRELTDAEKAQMEAARLEREEKLQAFTNSLNSEQKALFEAMMPVKPSEGQQPIKPDEAAMAAMKAKHEVFIASLTESQKTVYNELFARPGNKFGRPNDENRADMEAMRAQLDVKMNAFIATLTASQKSAFEALRPTPPAEGQQPVRPDEAAMTAMKEKQDAFIASLTESQKTAYDELFGRHGGGRPMGMPGGERKTN